MVSEIKAKAGEYYIRENVWFSLRQTDAGTLMSVSDGRINRRYSVCIDEDGCIVHGEVLPLTGDQPDTTTGTRIAVPPVIVKAEEAYDAVAIVKRALSYKNPLRRFKAFAKFRFTLRYTHRARPANRCFPMAGYRNDTGTFVMYRIPSNGGENLLRLIAPDKAIIDKADPDRLSPEEWERFLELKAGDVFRLNDQAWTKLTLEQVHPLVAGKVLQRTTLL